MGRLLEPVIGPFYAGMSFVITLPELRMTLHCPISTTIHKEVATLFAGDNGMLIEFEPFTGEASPMATKGIDFSWISRYGSAEAELFQISQLSVLTQMMKYFKLI